MPKSILKNIDSSEIFISEAERELRGDAGGTGNGGGIIVAGHDTTGGAEGSFHYGDIFYGYNDDGELVEMQRPSSLSLVETHVAEGGDTSNNEKTETNHGDDAGDDTLKFDASMSLSDIPGRESKSKTRNIDRIRRQISQQSNDGSTNRREDDNKSSRRRNKNPTHAVDDDVGLQSSRDAAIESEYTAHPSSNILAKRRAAERRAKVDMIRDATVYSGKTQGGQGRSETVPTSETHHKGERMSSMKFQQRRRSDSADAARERKEESADQANGDKRMPRPLTIPPPMEIALPMSELRRARSTEDEPTRRRRGSSRTSSKMFPEIQVADGSNGGDRRRSEGSLGRRKTSASALASASAKRGDVFEKYRRKSEQISAERGGEASESFRSVRSAASSHRSMASKYHKDATSSLRSLGSARRPTSVRASTRPSELISPASTATSRGGSADDSFNSGQSASRISVSSLSARNRQKNMVQGGSRRRYSSDANSSLEDGLSAAFGDSLDSIGSIWSSDDGSRSFSSNRSSGKRAYASSKEARMRIRDAASR